jgi:hypothetical protein
MQVIFFLMHLRLAYAINCAFDAGNVGADANTIRHYHPQHFGRRRSCLQRQRLWQQHDRSEAAAAKCLILRRLKGSSQRFILVCYR